MKSKLTLILPRTGSSTADRNNAGEAAQVHQLRFARPVRAEIDHSLRSDLAVLGVQWSLTKPRAIGERGHSCHSAESLCEVTLIVEANSRADLRDILRRLSQQALGVLDAPRQKVFRWRHPQDCPKAVIELCSGVIYHGGHFRHRHFLGEVLVDVIHDWQ